jgi:hypothetical protein
MPLPFMRKKAGFKPTDIGGCQLWLDFADITSLFQNTAGTIPVTSDSQNIQYIKDKSIAGNNASTTATGMIYRATANGGLPSVYFPGTQALGYTMNLAFGVSDATYFFVVNNQTTDGSISVYFAHVGSSRTKQFWWNTNVLQLDVGGIIGISGSTNVNQLTTIVSCTEVASTSILNGWQNGNPFSVTDKNMSGTLNTSFNSGVLGTDNGPFPITGYVSEVIIYNQILNSTDRPKVEGYLAQKWGLVSTLPVNNPGRTQVIYPHNLQVYGLATGQATLKPYIRSIGAVILGGSFQFTTTPSQYLSIPNSTGFTQNTAFTYELWYYPTSTDGGYIVAMLQHNWITIKWGPGGAGTIGLDMSYVGNPPGYVAQNRTYAINRWHHIALSWNGTNGVLYMNGVSEAVFTGAGGLVNDGNPLLIGQYQAQGQPTPLGYFTNIRFVKGVSVYTGAFTPPTAPLTVTQSAGTNISAITAGQTQLLISAIDSGSLLKDSSTNNFTITNNGSVAWNALTPFS